MTTLFMLKESLVDKVIQDINRYLPNTPNEQRQNHLKSAYKWDLICLSEQCIIVHCNLTSHGLYRNGLMNNKNMLSRTQITAYCRKNPSRHLWMHSEKRAVLTLISWRVGSLTDDCCSNGRMDTVSSSVVHHITQPENSASTIKTQL